MSKIYQVLPCCELSKYIEYSNMGFSWLLSSEIVDTLSKDIWKGLNQYKVINSRSAGAAAASKAMSKLKLTESNGANGGILTKYIIADRFGRFYSANKFTQQYMLVNYLFLSLDPKHVLFILNNQSI